MFGNLKLKTIVYVLTALIVCFMLYSFFGSVQLQRHLGTLENSWDGYQKNQNEKTRLRAELIMQLGYNGLIHKYDNYILRKSELHRIEAWMSYGKVDSTLKKLIRIADSHGERSSLEDIQVAVRQIGDNLQYVEDAIKKNVPAKTILREVDLYFGNTQRALDNLYEAFLIDGRSRKYLEQKEKIYVSIAAAFGLNGFIQSFKRYIILGDPVEIEKSRTHAQKIKTLADDYLRFDISFGERLALEDIISTLNLYLEMLEIAELNHNAGMESEMIDTLVRVNDTEAIRGFEILEAVNMEQILSSASVVAESIESTQRLQRDYAYQYAGFLLLILLLINFITTHYVIRPIERISNAFVELSQGKVDIELGPVTYKDNEIGMMERSFEVFRENEIRRQMAEEELKQLATTDSLTGLVNRNALQKRFNDLANIVKRSGEAIAILMLDLDNFKLVNDNFGHGVGDELLKDISKIMLSESRQTDIVARLGGDEFVIVLYAPHSRSDVEQLGQRIIKSISRLPHVNDNLFDVGVSIGLVFEQGPDISDLKSLLARADQALYSAKRNGKNRVVDINKELMQA